MDSFVQVYKFQKRVATEQNHMTFFVIYITFSVTHVTNNVIL